VCHGLAFALIFAICGCIAYNVADSHEPLPSKGPVVPANHAVNVLEGTNHTVR